MTIKDFIMNKIYSLLLCALLISSCLSACDKKQNSSIIKAKRKFAQYIEPLENHSTNGIIDLSEGPKTNYNFSFGPKMPSFDFKIENPYKYE